MNDWTTVIKQSVREKKPYLFNELKLSVKLNQNESPYDLPEELKREICERARKRPWNRYPDIIGGPVRSALARYLDVDSERIVAGVGSDELLYALAALILNREKKVLFVEPTFQMYRQCAVSFEARTIELTMDDGFAYPAERMLGSVARERPELIYIASPNSPTGNLCDTGLVEDILKEAPGLVVVDEAYYEFSGVSAVELQEQYENLVITRTFSKALRLAGLRLGYMIAHPKVNELIYKVKNPFSINTFTETAAVTLLENPQVISDNVEKILIERDLLLSGLSAVPGIRVYPTAANFFTVDTGGPGGEIVDALAGHDIAVRDISKYPMLENCIRMNAGTETENNRLLEAIKRIFTGE